MQRIHNKGSLHYAVVPISLLINTGERFDETGWRAVYYEDGSGLCHLAGIIPPDIFDKQDKQFVEDSLTFHTAFISKSKLLSSGVSFHRADWPDEMHTRELVDQFKNYLVHCATEISWPVVASN